MGEMRLQRFLSQAGVAARRKGEQLIVAGRVRVNGKVVRELGTKVDPDTDHIDVDGEGLVVEDKLYILLNKPKGCITAVSDDRGRPTVMDYLPNLPVSVAPVGRLDFYSEGVLLLTNDGDLAARLLAPKSHVPKTYHVKIRGQIRAGALQVLRDGVRLEDGTMTRPAEVDELPGDSKHSWLAITLHEGKSRQIHRMLESLGYTVTKLQRVAFANLSFHGLRVGDARELTQLELNELRDTVGLDHSAVARGRWHSQREDTDMPRRAFLKAEEERAETNPRPEPDPFPRPKPPAPPRSGGAARPPSPPRKRTTPRPGPRPDRVSESRAPARRESRAPARPESRAPARPESRAPARPASRAPARSESRAPARSESRAPARSESRAPRRDARSSAPPRRGPPRGRTR